MYHPMGHTSIFSDAAECSYRSRLMRPQRLPAVESEAFAFAHAGSRETEDGSVRAERSQHPKIRAAGNAIGVMPGLCAGILKRRVGRTDSVSRDFQLFEIGDQPGPRRRPSELFTRRGA
jgi:hypothetical protein